MEGIILTTRGELESLIHNTVRKALNEQTANSTETKDAILGVQQASEYLNLAKQTLYGFTSKNEIPFIKRGKKLYFKKSELEQWLLEGRRKTFKNLKQETIDYINKLQK